MDSLIVVETCKTLFKAIETNDKEVLNDISTDKIYCIICFNPSDLSDSPYMLEKKDFFENHLTTIKNNESYQRAVKSNESILIVENDNRSFLTVLWTTYKQDEIAPGHEGEQFGILFKKVNDEFKFSGVETIP